MIVLKVTKTNLSRATQLDLDRYLTHILFLIVKVTLFIQMRDRLESLVYKTCSHKACVKKNTLL